MRKLEVRLRRAPDDIVPVGTLLEHRRRLYFEYAADFLRTGLELSPFKLPAAAGLVEHTDHAFGPLPGLFDDSLPDGWGLLLMDRHFRRQGLDPAALSPLDRLAFLGERTMGALTYHPPTVDDSGRDDRLIDLHALGRNAEQVVAGDSTEILPTLLRAGGSPGGARPKVLVGVRGDQLISGEADLPARFLARPPGEHWIVKFASTADGRDAGRVEYAYSLMARAAGIDMPPTRLFKAGSGRDVRWYSGVRRFDRRPGNRRVHMHTFANLVHANFRVPSTDYEDVFKVTAALTRSERDKLRLFRLMAFNVAAHNRDDHAKNFAFVLDDRSGAWSLAPAYDLTFAAGPGGEHSMTILGEGRSPTREHCLDLAAKVGIKPRAAALILKEVNDAVAGCSSWIDQAGCKRSSATREIARSLRGL